MTEEEYDALVADHGVETAQAAIDLAHELEYIIQEAREDGISEAEAFAEGYPPETKHDNTYYAQKIVEAFELATLRASAG